ncbi:hypothetical protein CU103_08150 [Phyllobacterium sophorae]|uniref:Luciferase-like domain-containing protein n=1 Tax=Phyllobacterium sophorae TaxID=1520277 RepID=A0A2P7BEZ6_9HYPH|nr:hypothetical protein CU103_08150 [Phyllobacterium sophorae]
MATSQISGHVLSRTHPDASSRNPSTHGCARQLTELDRLSDGRLSIRFPAGLKVAANDQERRVPRNPVEMFQQTDEYLVLLKRLWSNDRSFDHQGPFYSVTAGYVDRRSPRRAGIPIRMGGTSGTALKFAGRHADMFELTPGTPEEVVKLMERMQVAAASYGREDKMRFALPVSVGALRQPFQILRLQNSMPLPKKSTFLVRQCKSARNWSLHVHRC